MSKVTYFAYGLFCYAVGMASLVYMFGWLVNFVVPRQIDSVQMLYVLPALSVNLALFILYGLVHSIMARPNFKKSWTAFVPKPIERSTYVLFAGTGLFFVMLMWQPMGIDVWKVTNPIAAAVLYGVYALGWALLVGSTFMINHFDLFGLRQVWLHAQGKLDEPLPFVTPMLSQFVRHPLYVGWITLVWATPAMSLSHLIFALGTTVYILFAIPYEERNLIEFHGDAYVNYRAQTPMLVPGMGGTPAPGLSNNPG